MLFSVRSKWLATSLRSNQHPACSSYPETGVHRPTVIRHNGAGLQHRSCQKQGMICPNRTGQSKRQAGHAVNQYPHWQDCARAHHAPKSCAVQCLWQGEWFAEPFWQAGFFWFRLAWADYRPSGCWFASLFAAICAEKLICNFHKTHRILTCHNRLISHICD